MAVIDLLRAGAGGKIAAPVEGDIPANAIPGGGYWTGITCSEDGSKIASCSGNGYVFTSSDFGNTWTKKQNSPKGIVGGHCIICRWHKTCNSGFWRIFIYFIRFWRDLYTDNICWCTQLARCFKFCRWCKTSCY